MKNYDGGRPLWQWILIYAAIGVVVYAAIYYLFLVPKGGSNYSNPTPSGTQQNNQPSPTPSPSPYKY